MDIQGPALYSGVGLMMAHNVHSGVVFKSKTLITMSTWIMAFTLNLKSIRIDDGAYCCWNSTMDIESERRCQVICQ